MGGVGKGRLAGEVSRGSRETGMAGSCGAEQPWGQRLPSLCPAAS